MQQQQHHIVLKAPELSYEHHLQLHWRHHLVQHFSAGFSGCSYVCLPLGKQPRQKFCPEFRPRATFKMYPEVVLASQQISAIEQQRNAKIKPFYRIPGRTTINMRSQKTKKRRKNKCFNFLTKCPELKIQNDTSSYHDCIGLHFPGVEVGIINNNGGYAIPHCFSCCNTMLYNSEQHATITEG